jgi:hypothetical protein
MKKYIENLRQESEAKKSFVAFWGAFIGTGMIALFWLLGVTYVSPDENRGQAANTTGPIENILNKVTGSVDEVKQRIDNQ